MWKNELITRLIQIQMNHQGEQRDITEDDRVRMTELIFGSDLPPTPAQPARNSRFLESHPDYPHPDHIGLLNTYRNQPLRNSSLNFQNRYQAAENLTRPLTQLIERGELGNSDGVGDNLDYRDELIFNILNDEDYMARTREESEQDLIEFRKIFSSKDYSLH